MSRLVPTCGTMGGGIWVERGKRGHAIPQTALDASIARGTESGRLDFGQDIVSGTKGLVFFWEKSHSNNHHTDAFSLGTRFRFPPSLDPKPSVSVVVSSFAVSGSGTACFSSFEIFAFEAGFVAGPNEARPPVFFAKLFGTSSFETRSAFSN